MVPASGFGIVCRARTLERAGDVPGSVALLRASGFSVGHCLRWLGPAGGWWFFLTGERWVPVAVSFLGVGLDPESAVSLTL